MIYKHAVLSVFLDYKEQIFETQFFQHERWKCHQPTLQITYFLLPTINLDFPANLNSLSDHFKFYGFLSIFFKEGGGLRAVCLPPYHTPHVPQVTTRTLNNCIPRGTPSYWHSCPCTTHLPPTGPQNSLRTREMSASYMFSACLPQN